MTDEEVCEQAQYATIDPVAALQSCPAMTTILYRVCNNDASKFKEAVRLIGLIQMKTLEIKKGNQDV